MRKLFACLVLAAIALASTAASSEDWASLSKAMNASCAKFAGDIKDITMTMDMTNTSSEGVIKSSSTLYEKGGKFRAEMQMKEFPGGGQMMQAMAGMKTVVVSDGSKVWMLNPMSGKVELPIEQAGEYRGQWHCTDYIPKNAEIVGSEVVNGRDCHILAVKDPDAEAVKIWIDKKTYQLQKIAEKDGTTVLFSDFRKVQGGYEFPYKTEIYSEGKIATTIAVSSIDVNKGLKDDLFNPDKIEAAAPNMQDMMKKLKEKAKEAEGK